jgi:hypothetical protein
MHCFHTFLKMLVQCMEVNGCQLVQFPVVDLHCTHNVWDRFFWLPSRNFYRWKSEKSGAVSTSILVSIRFLSRSYQGCRTPILSGQHCGEKITLVTTFDLFWISWRIYLHSQVHIKKILDVLPWITVSWRHFLPIL